MNTTPPFSTSGPSSFHYRPRTAILNNLEYDHADIYPDVPRSAGNSINCCARSRRGRLIVNGADPELAKTLSEAAGRRASRSVWREQVRRPATGRRT